MVFNLVESLGGYDGLMHLATSLLDVLGLPYTGSPTEALLAEREQAGGQDAARRGRAADPALGSARGK